MTADNGYRDSSGLMLTEYPRPSVAVDTALLTVADGGLAVAVVDTERGACLPGTFLHEGETLARAVHRSLRDKAGVTGRSPEQLRVFDALGRDDRGWVLSVAHVDVVPFDRLSLGPDARLVPAADARGLAFDHDAIVRLAVAWVRSRYAEHPDPSGLLAEPFTLRDLQLLHEAVAGERVTKDAFRRSMERLLTPAGRMTEGAMGKPARLWLRG